MKGSVYASENVLIFEVLEFTSFFSFWYWALVILVWGISAQIILSVPFHTLQLAKSQTQEQQNELLISLQLHARRTVAAYTPNMSLFLSITGGFLFGFCGFTGFYFDIRFTEHKMGLYYSYFFYPYNNYHITYYKLGAEPWVHINTIIYEGEEERVEKKGVKGKHSKKVKRKK